MMNADQKTACTTSQATKSTIAETPEVLRTYLSPAAHTSLSFSCADKLLWQYADQIFKEKELAIAYPCLGCRGGLTLFLAYLSLCVQTNTPGRPFDSVLVYPGTAEIRESYILDSRHLITMREERPRECCRVPVVFW
jgi:hypothetical protein